MNLTVVVTTYGARAPLLRRCLESAVKAGCWRIVVTSMCSGPDEWAVINEFTSNAAIECRVTSLDHDLGVNELWLRGVYYAATPFVLILHDDDYLDASFGSEWKSEIEPQLLAGCGFASWRGSADNGRCITEIKYFDGPTRVMGTGKLARALLTPQSGPVSPVVSVFQRADAIRFLKEAEVSNRDARQFTRPTMMLGNELRLYLRCCEKYRQWFYLDKVLTYYGAHPGSETVHASRGKDAWAKFVAGYDATREQFRAARSLEFKPASKILHVWSAYEGKGESKRRTDFAASTWEPLYASGEVLPFPVRDSMLSRSSKTELGDTRAVPFLKDLVDWGCSFAAPEDVVVYSNADLCVVPSFASQILGRFYDKSRGADFAWRYNFYGPLVAHLTRCDHGFKDLGIDLIAVRPGWWLDHRDYMPDMLIACETWDWAARSLITEAHGGSAGMDFLTYHEFHEPQWRQVGFRTTNPGQQYNINLARDFFLSRGAVLEDLATICPPITRVAK